MRAELIAVGSELLRPGRRDTNAEWLRDRLDGVGVQVVARALVADDAELIADVLRSAWSRAELVLVTGGLGPTEDDRTREAVALALKVPLETDEEQLARLRRRFESFGRPFLPEQGRQAIRPRGAVWIDNPVGSAPGLLVTDGARILAVLPGVPAEMKSMFDAAVMPRLAKAAPGAVSRRVFKVAGRTESSVDGQLRDLYGWPGVEATILGGVRGIELHVRVEAYADKAADDRLREVEAEIRSRLGEDLYGVDDDTLVGRVAELMLASGRTLATAESCTAGLLGGALTRVPGSSRWFRGGLIVYSDELKQRLAGVAERTLRDHGAVSEAVALQLAGGARERCGADIGVGITGIAGPTGGSDDKPVGLVHLALEDDAESRHVRLHLPGDRHLVRALTVTIALDQLRRRLTARRESAS